MQMSRSFYQIRLLSLSLVLITLVVVMQLPQQLQPAHAHLVDRSVNTFAINRELSKTLRDRFNVSVRSPASHAMCTFEWVTYVEQKSAAEEAAEKAAAEAAAQEAAARAAAAKPILFDEWVTTWPTPCLESPHGSWVYRICLGAGQEKRVTQLVGQEQYNLGSFREQTGTTILFDGGDKCPNNIARETKVFLECHEETPGVMVARASEPSTCHYEMVIISSALCADPRFPHATTSVLPPHLVGNGNDPFDYWRLQIDPIDSANGPPVPGRPAHVCTVHPLHAPQATSNANDGSSSSTRLSAFALTMHVQGTAQESAAAAAPAQLFEQAVFASGTGSYRQSLDPTHVEEIAGGVRSTRAFREQLDMVEIVAF